MTTHYLRLQVLPLSATLKYLAPEHLLQVVALEQDSQFPRQAAKVKTGHS